MKSAMLIAGLVICFVAVTSHAGIVQFIDLEFAEGPAAWEAALGNAGKVSKGTTFFGDDPYGDYGLQAFPSPLTSAGGGPVSAGMLLDNLELSAVGVGGTQAMAAVGPSEGHGNATNAVLANLQTDHFRISVIDGEKTAFMLNAITLGVGETVDIAVYDVSGAVIGSMIDASAPTTGWRWGIISAVPIGSIELYDPSLGAEGLLGLEAYNVPEPAIAALLGLGSFVTLRRRRNR